MTTAHDLTTVPLVDHHLDLAGPNSSARFALNGRPLPPGSSVELLIDPDTWVLGRFDLIWSDEGPIPLFALVLPARPGWFEGTVASIRLTAAACLRWPDEY